MGLLVRLSCAQWCTVAGGRAAWGRAYPGPAGGAHGGRVMHTLCAPRGRNTVATSLIC
jgi:hypothetical protein